MLKDRYDNTISTSSTTARDQYIAAVDGILADGAHIAATFEAAIAADPDFCLAHVGLARALQGVMDIPAARAAMDHARTLTDGLTDREKSHVNALGLLIDGKIKQAVPTIREHVEHFPRDVLVAQPSTGIFGLIGTSGLPGREAEQLAYTTTLAQHYGDDWWFLGQHAFAMCEVGQLDRADVMVDKSLAGNPRNANAAHIRSHVHYETGETQAGMQYLKDWLPDYDRSARLHGHIAWHIALWALEQGDTDEMWHRIDTQVQPGVSLGLPLNVLTDTASFLYRAELAGIDVSAERWKAISTYAAEFFPKTGFCFADIHAALAHAMAGDAEALEKIIENPVGPAADLVREFSGAYRAIAAQNWAEATKRLTAGMGDHARISGSRAQRDLLVYTLLGTLLKQDRQEEARRVLALSRPAQVGKHPVAGL